MAEMRITPQHLETLLQNFAEYTNPETGEHDPWFTLPEIRQQFAGVLDPNEVIADQLWMAMIRDLEKDGKVRRRVADAAGAEFAWQS